MTKKLFIFLVFLWALPSHFFSTPVDAQTNPAAPIIFFETPQLLHIPFLDYINNAKSSIVMEMYHLDDPKIVMALINAAQGNNLSKSKVKISIIVDGATFGSDPNLVTAAQQLTDAGVKITKSSMLPNGFSITHVKAMVVDKTVAFITSINLTTKAAVTRDYGVISRDPGVVGELLAVFAEDLKNAADNTRLTPLPLLKMRNLIWSPVDSEGKLRKLILDSISISPGMNPTQNNRYVFTTVENLGDCAIQDALKQAAATGVDVRIIVPGCDLNPCPLWNFRFLNDLTRNTGGKPAVKARYMPMPAVPNAIQPYMHGKMIVVGNGTAYLGSVNFSANSMLHARELGIIVQTGMYPGASQVIGGLIASFKVDWENSLDAGVPPTNCPLPKNPMACPDLSAPVCSPGSPPEFAPFL